ncbi:hypothetical protein BGZ54_006577 [Gamsiella multidivaricata]|nr:hypothetical protein BGZ54_006577 [Gamsiella multidivaricata]
MDSTSHSSDEPHTMSSPDVASKVDRLATKDPSQDTERKVPDDDGHGCYQTTATKRRARSKPMKKGLLPIDEPTSGSGGGWVSSECDQKEGAEPKPDLELEPEPEPELRQKPELIPEISTLLSGIHNTLNKSQAPSADSTRATVSATTAVTTDKHLIRDTGPELNNRTTRTAVAKKWRPWQAAKILKEMQALFIKEQKKQQEKQEKQEKQQQREQESRQGIQVDEPKPTSAKGKERIPADEDVEDVYEQLPGLKPILASREPRSHYRNFWRACTDDERESWTEPTTAQTDLDLTTSMQCLSEDQVAGRHLLAMRVRNAFLEPKGKSLLEGVLAKSMVGFATDATEQTENKEAEVSKTIISEKPDTVSTKPVAIADPKAQQPTHVEKRVAVVDVVPLERVFIFVDNSNILTGFYHYQQRHEAIRMEEDVARMGSMVPTDVKRTDDQKENPTERPPRSNVQETPIEGIRGVERQDRVDTDSDEEIIVYPRRPHIAAKVTKPSVVNDETHSGSAIGSTLTDHAECEVTTEQCAKWPRLQKQPAVSSSGARMVKGKFPKFKYGAFFDILKRNRPVARQVLVGSSPLFQELDAALEHNYEAIILKRVKRYLPGELGALPIPVKKLRYPSTQSSTTGNRAASTAGRGEMNKDDVCGGATQGQTRGNQAEQGVDELLHLKMLETLFDNEPATMVLATGDGCVSEFGGDGFRAIVRRALDLGWQVEIVSWDEQLSGVYLDLALEYGYKGDDRESAKKQRARRMRPNGGNSSRRGHLRVWCLDWYGDQFFLEG